MIKAASTASFHYGHSLMAEPAAPAAALERGSEHPPAEAIVSGPEERGLRILVISLRIPARA